MRYVLVVTDSPLDGYDFEIPGLKVDHITIGQQTIGRHYRCQRYTDVVNMTKHRNLLETGNNRITEWYRNELIAMGDRNLNVVNPRMPKEDDANA